MFIRMDKLQDQNGFRIPSQFFVYHLNHKARPLVFAEKPAQEIYLKGANLRAQLSVADFKP